MPSVLNLNKEANHMISKGLSQDTVEKDLFGYQISFTRYSPWLERRGNN